MDADVERERRAALRQWRGMHRVAEASTMLVLVQAQRRGKSVETSTEILMFVRLSSGEDFGSTFDRTVGHWPTNCKNAVCYAQ
jgi:hypothetical protein